MLLLIILILFKSPEWSCTVCIPFSQLLQALARHIALVPPFLQFLQVSIVCQKFNVFTACLYCFFCRLFAIFQFHLFVELFLHFRYLKFFLLIYLIYASIMAQVFCSFLDRKISIRPSKWSLSRVVYVHLSKKWFIPWISKKSFQARDF